MTFIAGFAIAYANGWKMALVVTAGVPIIAAATIVQTKIQFGYSSQVRRSCFVTSFLLFHAVLLCHAQRSVAANSELWLLMYMLFCARCNPGYLVVLMCLVHAFLQESSAFALANHTAAESFSNIRTIAAFGMVRSAGLCCIAWRHLFGRRA